MSLADNTLFDPAAYRPPPFHDTPATLDDAIEKCFGTESLSSRFMELGELLLYRNPAAKRIVESLDPALDRLTRDQLVLATLYELDLEVQNGGLSQFLWNRPAWVSHAPAALDAIGCVTLADVLRRDVQRVIEQCGSVEAYSAGNSLEDYSEQAEAMEFDEFESAYYSCDDERYARVIGYVREHLDGFIRRSGRSE